MTEAQLQAAVTLFDVEPDLTVTRQCEDCGEVKPLATGFKTGGSGKRRKVCRKCNYAQEKAWRDAQGADYRRARSQWQLYRLPWDDYLAMLAGQNSACAICKEPFGDNPKLIDVDHDHKCDHPGKGIKCCRACVRGILCHRCNMFVGFVESFHPLLGDALSYLGVNGVVIWAHVMRDIGYRQHIAIADEMEEMERGAAAGT